MAVPTPSIVKLSAITLRADGTALHEPSGSAALVEPAADPKIAA